MKLSPNVLLFGLAALALSKKKSASPPSPAPSLRVPKDGPRFTLEELRAFAAQIGFPDPNLAAAVAMAESGGFAGAVGDLDKGKSVGLWQINLPSHPEYKAQDLLDPTYNGQAALQISQSGTVWTPWTTFRTGAYQRYMPPAIAAAAPAAQLEAREPEPSTAPAPAAAHEKPDPPDAELVDDDDEPQPLEVEVLDQVEGVEQTDANGVDARVRVSDAPRTGRARRARRG